MVLGREPYLGRRLAGGDARYDLPIVAGPLVPRPVKFTFHVGAPLTAGAGEAPAALAARVRGALEVLIAAGLAGRRSIWWG